MINLDIEDIINLIEEDNNEGMCTECGFVQGAVEPDASEYECEECGSYSVYGSDNLLLMT